MKMALAPSSRCDPPLNFEFSSPISFIVLSLDGFSFEIFFNTGGNVSKIFFVSAENRNDTSVNSGRGIVAFRFLHVFRQEPSGCPWLR
jgi:hypothetical protein